MGGTAERAPSVMLVDDEPDVRMLMRLRLELDIPGVRVVAEAADGEEALLVWRGLAPPDPDVVLLDHRMHGLTGTDVAERMLTERPRQLIILCSGVLTHALRARAEMIGIAACINKQQVEQLPAVVSGLMHR